MFLRLHDDRDELLLDLNEVDGKGRNALFYCITGSDVTMLDRLVAAGVKVAPSTEGITVLMQVRVGENSANSSSDGFTERGNGELGGH